MKTLHHLVPNDDGWHLSLHQTWDEKRLVKGRRPVLIVPGYGMNSFIFSFHPRGLSLEGFLAQAGFEVWRVDLRAQGDSVAIGAGKYDDDDYRIEDLAVTDLGAAIRAALEHTRTCADRADVIGCSLGGTFMFVHAALNPRHRIGAMVAMGSPVRWVRINPILRVAFAWPMLVGALQNRRRSQPAHQSADCVLDSEKGPGSSRREYLRRAGAFYQSLALRAGQRRRHRAARNGIVSGHQSPFGQQEAARGGNRGHQAGACRSFCFK
ncbi:MAG: alpha/beta fold hydrolase [Deltaproteobacteria bacterium]|nr:alpha/beta fold hydrolase [Deltaproteobacteria bacterium]